MNRRSAIDPAIIARIEARVEAAKLLIDSSDDYKLPHCTAKRRRRDYNAGRREFDICSPLHNHRAAAGTGEPC